MIVDEDQHENDIKQHAAVVPLHHMSLMVITWVSGVGTEEHFKDFDKEVSPKTSSSAAGLGGVRQIRTVFGTVFCCGVGVWNPKKLHIMCAHGLKYARRRRKGRNLSQQTPLRQRQLKHQSTGIVWVPKICHCLPAATFCEGPGPPEVPVPCLDDMQRSLLELLLESFL